MMNCAKGPELVPSLRSGQALGLVKEAAQLACAMLLVAACTPAPPAPTAAPVPTAASGPVATKQTAPGPAPVASPGVSPAAATKPAASPAASPAAAVASPSPVALPTPAPAPKPAVAGTFGLGHPATADEIRKIAFEVLPDGRGLPPGAGTAREGVPVYAQKCPSCHGPNGEGTSIGPKLVDPTPFKPGVTVATVGNYWPYATTVWDYINRAMPFDKPGSLAPDEVYALTAYLLAQNQIIGEDDRMDAQSLPKVRMPNAGGFTSPDPRPDIKP